MSWTEWGAVLLALGLISGVAWEWFERRNNRK